MERYSLEVNDLVLEVVNQNKALWHTFYLCTQANIGSKDVFIFYQSLIGKKREFITNSLTYKI